MNTDRTQPARPVALNDRSSAAPAERRPEGAFAALLDAVAPAPRREEPRRDDVRDRGPEPRDAGVQRDQPHEAAADSAPRDAAGPAEQPSPNGGAPVQAGPVAAPPAALPIEAPATPALPTVPLFMLAPEAVAAATPPTTLPAAPTAETAEATVPAATAPLPGAAVPPTTAAPAEPVAEAPAEAAPATPLPKEAAPAQAPAAGQTAAPETKRSAEPIVAGTELPATPETHAAAPAPAPAHATATEPSPAAAPAAQGTTTEPVAPTPISAPPSGPVAPERTVPLHRTPAAVATLLHVAAERGITHARMALRPVELGGIEIRLQASAAGIAAQVIADSPEAARLLAQAGDDLRRALEARDVTLISLEVSTSGEQQQSARGEWTDGDDAGLTSPSRAAGDAEGDAEPGPTTQTVIELPGGLLVDVLA